MTYFSPERFKALRKARGLSQERLALVAGVCCSTVAAIETGRNKNPSLETLLSLAACLDTGLASFFAEAVKKKEVEKKRKRK